ncbi:DUF4404 family protein [Fangia hongkongensis]|uniref:DUF4404 family protein n=1 Tax=Fangia hongkongensis TaxID=270495 RepID=UPI000360DCF0|nr:DUF4404 family protein [Fangia hongkongensis]MBK2124714.1 DUF4404 family protein [Fangia hongkongensis]
MPKNVIKEIKDVLQASDKLSYSQTEKLLGLLDQLQQELEKLPEDQKVQALEIAKLTKSKIELSRLQDPQDTEFNDLQQAVVEYEVTHPRLTHTVRSICNFLMSIGV